MNAKTCWQRLLATSTRKSHDLEQESREEVPIRQPAIGIEPAHRFAPEHRDVRDAER
jgi:hypothetical protein